MSVNVKNLKYSINILAIYHVTFYRLEKKVTSHPALEVFVKYCVTKMFDKTALRIIPNLFFSLN